MPSSNTQARNIAGKTVRWGRGTGSHRKPRIQKTRLDKLRSQRFTGGQASTEVKGGGRFNCSIHHVKKGRSTAKILVVFSRQLPYVVSAASRLCKDLNYFYANRSKPRSSTSDLWDTRDIEKRLSRLPIAIEEAPQSLF